MSFRMAVLAGVLGSSSAKDIGHLHGGVLGLWFVMLGSRHCRPVHAG